MSKFQAKFNRVSPIILTCLSAAGVVGTAITAVWATPKALQSIAVKKQELETEELTPTELVQTTWQYYIPAAAVGLGTVLCIVGIGACSKRSQAALTSAYAMLTESYKQYRKAANAVYGRDADARIHAEIAKDADISDSGWGYQIYNMDMDPESELVLCHDTISRRYFRTTMAAVINAQYHLNRNLQLRGYCPLNEYYDFLGLEHTDDGNERGWAMEALEEGGLQWIDFDNRKTILDDGLECVIVSTAEPDLLNEYL